MSHDLPVPRIGHWEANLSPLSPPYSGLILLHLRCCHQDPDCSLYLTTPARNFPLLHYFPPWRWRQLVRPKLLKTSSEPNGGNYNVQSDRCENLKSRRVRESHVECDTSPRNCCELYAGAMITCFFCRWRRANWGVSHIGIGSVWRPSSSWTLWNLTLEQKVAWNSPVSPQSQHSWNLSRASMPTERQVQ